MTDCEEFSMVAGVIARNTSLNELQSRGLVRRLLKQAGLAAHEVTAQQLAAVGRTLLAESLRKNGVADPGPVVAGWLEVCAKQEKSGDRTRASNTVEAVFARLGLRS